MSSFHLSFLEIAAQAKINKQKTLKLFIFKYDFKSTTQTSGFWRMPAALRHMPKCIRSLYRIQKQAVAMASEIRDGERTRRIHSCGFWLQRASYNDRFGGWFLQPLCDGLRFGIDLERDEPYYVPYKRHCLFHHQSIHPKPCLRFASHDARLDRAKRGSPS